MRTFPVLYALGAAGALLSACGDDSSPPPALSPQDWVEANPHSTSLPCMGQRAVVPPAATALQTATPNNSKTSRTEMAVYVAYQVTTDELFGYFSFDPSLPRTDISTETARKLLKYAYVSYAMKQPADVGGGLTLLSSRDLLHLADFERFEVVDGQLAWRLIRGNDGSYSKQLSIYDEDPTNDPDPRDACLTGDIVGMCQCDFSGPSILVTIEGKTPLTP